MAVLADSKLYLDQILFYIKVQLDCTIINQASLTVLVILATLAYQNWHRDLIGNPISPFLHMLYFGSPHFCRIEFLRCCLAHVVFKKAFQLTNIISFLSHISYYPKEFRLP